MAFTVTVGAAFDAAIGNAQAPVLPSGTLTNKLLLLVTGSGTTSATAPATPSGYTILGNLTTTDPVIVFGKIAGSSESAPSLAAWSAGASAGFMLAIESPTGWPAIGSILAAAGAGGNPDPNQPSSGTTSAYAGISVQGNGNCILRVGAKNGTLTATPSAVNLTSGYTAAGFAARSTVAVHGEMLTAVSSVGSDPTDRSDVTLTGDSASTNRAALTFEFVPAAASSTTISVDDSTPTPTQALVITKAEGAFAGTVTVQLDDNTGTPVDVSAAVTGTGATRTLTLGAGSINNYDDSNATWEKIRWNQPITLTVTDSDGSDEATITITPPVDDHFDTLGASGVYVTSPGGSGDDSYVHIVSGDGEGLPVLADLQGSTVPTVARFLCFDVSANKWLAQIEHLFDVSAVTLDGEYADSFTGANGTLITAHEPDADVVGTGYRIEKDVSTAAAVSNAVTIQNDQLEINDANEGAVIDVGTTEPDFSFDWVIPVGATGKQMIAQVRRIDDTEHIHLYCTQSDGLVRINERVASANIGVTGDNEHTHTFTDGVTYRFRIHVIGNAIDVYIDDVIVLQVESTRDPNTVATDVGLFSAGAGTFPIYFDRANVYSDYTETVTAGFSRASVIPVMTAHPVYRNELVWSEDFGNAAWTKTRSSATWDSAESDPDGDIGCWTLVEDGTASNTHFFLSGTITPAASTLYSASAFVKASNRTQAAIGLTGAGNSDSIVIFNLSTGAFVATSGVAPTGYAISDEGSGWYRISMYWTTTSSAAMAMRVYAAASGSVTFSGASQESLLVADAMIHTGATLRPYIKTELTPLLSNQVIARVTSPYNAIAYSNDLSDAAWTKNGFATFGDTITLNAGASNGWGGAVLKKLKENTSNTSRTAEQLAVPLNPAGLTSFRFLFAAANNGLVLGIYTKGSTSSHNFDYRFTMAGGLWYSAVTGNASLHSYSIVQVDTLTIDGEADRPVWEVTIRGWADTISDVDLTSLVVQLYDGWTSSWLGDGSTGTYVGKLQMVSGYDLPGYDADTTTASLPFAAAADEATLNGVAAPVAANNLAMNSEFSGAVSGSPGTAPTSWAIGFGTNAVTTVGQDEYGAVKIDCDSGERLYYSQTLNATSGVQYTLSVYLVAVTGNVGDLLYVTAGTGTVTINTSVTNPSTTGWKTLVFTCTGTGTLSLRAGVGCSATVGATVSATIGRVLCAVGSTLPEYVRSAASSAAYVQDRVSNIVTMPAMADFAPSEAHEATQWYVNLPLAVSDGTGTATGTIQIVAPDEADYGYAGFGSYANAPAGTEPGDPVYVEIVSGAGTPNPEEFSFIATEASVVRYHAFNLATGLWLTYVQRVSGLGSMLNARIYLSISLGI